MMQPHRAARSSNARRRLLAGLTVAWLLAALTIPMLGATAFELPPSGNVYYIQTNGPNAAASLGDWYTANTGGNGQHYIDFYVPCGWPSDKDVDVDLYSPEMNSTAGTTGSEEPTGALDSTQFELYGPDPGSLAVGAGIAGSQTTYPPSAAAQAWTRFRTLSAPVACGRYVVRSAVILPEANDQNGWRLRVGWDDDGTPTNAPPADYDDIDGTPGTNDEIVSSVAQTSYQHDAGAVACQTFYQYVTPAQASATFNNFDMDGNTRVRYYSPSAAYDPLGATGGVVGTVSGGTVWNNGGTLNTRVGDTVANPQTGWWRLVGCVGSHNQLIMEGQNGVPTFFSQPPTPDLTISKSDGQAVAAPGESLTYAIDVENVASGPSAGAATNVVVTDTIPTGTSYDSCSVATPASGTWACSQSGGVVTFTQTGWIAAGDTAQLTVSVTVDQGVAGSITNTADVDYEDALGNPFPTETDDDTDTLSPRADLGIVKTDSADPVDPGDSFDYDLVVTNHGPSDTTGVVVTDSVPAGLSVSGVSAPSGSCSNVGNDVTCTKNNLANGASWTIHVHVDVDPSDPGTTYTNTAFVDGDDPDPVAGNDSDTEDTTVVVADLHIVKTDSADPLRAGDSFTYTLAITNQGPDDATNVVVHDPVPSAFNVTGVSDDGPGSCTISGGDVDCTRPSLANGATWTITIDVDVPATEQGGTYDNTASVDADETDPDATDDDDAESTTVGRESDIHVTKTDDIDPAAPGDTVTYTIQVRNQGPSDANNVTVNDPVPVGLTVLGTSDDGPGTCSALANVVVCTQASLANGTTWTIQVAAQVAPTQPGGTLTNTATASADEPDFDPTDDSDTEDTEIADVADLEVTKRADVDSPAVGDFITYTIDVENHGPSDATGVVVSDDLPDGLRFVSSDATQGTYDEGAGEWTVGSLANGVTATLQIRTQVLASAEGETIVNRASVTDVDQVDPISPNDSDDGTVEVLDETDDGGDWTGDWHGDGNDGGGDVEGETAATGANIASTMTTIWVLVAAGLASIAVAKRRRRHIA